MSELDFKVEVWLPNDLPDPRERETLSSFTITAGHEPLTEVNDVLAHTVRDYIQVPAYLVARWFILNWWRLRWEPRPSVPTFAWQQAHSLAAISSDYAWPSVTFTSDGDFIHVQTRAEPIADVAAIRYLRNVDVRVPARHFERAVDGLVDMLEMRLASRLPNDRELNEIRAELRDERMDPTLARECRLQALVGLHPGAADTAWLASAVKLAMQAGPSAGDEVVAASSMLPDQLADAQRIVTAMRASPWTIKLDPRVDVPLSIEDELPWQRGRRLASAFRSKIGEKSGPLDNKVLEDLLETKLPVTVSSSDGQRVLAGGFRDVASGGRTAVLATSPRPTTQRFYLSRLIGAAIVADPADCVLPVSRVKTSLQKFERTFAQEFLCPWDELDAFTADRGTDEEGVLEAAEYFAVSEYLVLTALVNNDKISRDRLPLELV